LRLRLDWGNNAVLQFRRGEESGLYNPSDPNHQLVYLIIAWTRLT
jgi:hypothetical protein